MKTYKIEISGTDNLIRLALAEACGDCLQSIEPNNPSGLIDLEHAQCNSIATINAHDDDDFAHMMIETGRELKRIS